MPRKYARRRRRRRKSKPPNAEALSPKPTFTYTLIAYVLIISLYAILIKGAFIIFLR